MIFRGDLWLTHDYSGGNDPAVVFDDVDVDEVAQKVAGLAFLNSGQVRIDSSRALRSTSGLLMNGFTDLSRSEAHLRAGIHCGQIPPGPREGHEEP